MLVLGGLNLLAGHEAWVGLEEWGRGGAEGGLRSGGGVGLRCEPEGWSWKGGRKLLDIKFILTVQQTLLPIAKEMMYFILLTFVI